MADHNQNENLDAFDAWLKSCSAAEPPADLRERCRDTIPEPIQTRKETPYRPLKYLWRVRATQAAIGMSALAATVAIVWFFAFSRAPRSVLAQAIEESRAAVALHVVGRFSDPDREPNEVLESQWGWVRDSGASNATKNEGKSRKRILWRDGTMRIGDAEPYSAERDPGKWSLNLSFPWLPDTEQSDLLRYERIATEQEVPIEIEEIRVDGRKIRRVRIAGLRVDELESSLAEAALFLDMVTDIDASTNRIVRVKHHYRAVGKDRKNRLAQLDATLESTVDYPDPEAINSSTNSK